VALRLLQPFLLNGSLVIYFHLSCPPSPCSTNLISWASGFWFLLAIGVVIPPLKSKELLMLRLFRRKMVSVVKWFQGSHFSGNYFPSKAFFGVWRVQKIANIFLYFYSIILTYKNQFLFTT
jgi:hypothetical protein